mgnify:CR=1 FL=1
MSTFLELFNSEIGNIKHVLTSLPFSHSDQRRQLPYFMDVYQVNGADFHRLNEQGSAFPLDANKFLKLGISLGNLIKLLQQDEEQFLEVQRKTQQFNRSVGGPLGTPQMQSSPQIPQTPALKQQALEGSYFDRRSSASATNPVVSTPAAIPGPVAPHQTRFAYNLLKILKNYDIGTGILLLISAQGSLGGQNDLPPPQMLTTSSSLTILGQPVVLSPIKLLSKQLLIEKLEINIELDNLFTYKTVLLLILRIYETILSQLEASGNSSVLTAVLARDFTSSSSSSSIFLTTSYSLSELALTIEEYLVLLKQIVLRFNAGVMEPFIQVVLATIVEVGVNERFSNMMKSLEM